MEKQIVITDALSEYVPAVLWRRKLHKFPELSFQEKLTSRFIAEVLEHEKIEFRHIAGTGILARIEGRENPGRAVVLRADMDALPITEQNDIECRSVNKGTMHACGHDVHMAILLGVMKLLKKHSNKIKGTVFGLFQPGEEMIPGGASMVLKEDPFRSYDVVAFIGQHVEPQLPTGTFGFRAGKYMASGDEIRFRVKGHGGHAALRQHVIDPVQAAGALLTALYSIPEENPDKSLPTIISIGKVTANGATNVVPDDAYLEGTMRTFDEGWRREMKNLIRARAAEVEAKFGVKIEVDISEGYPSVVNNVELTGKIIRATGDLFGGDSVAELPLRPTCEDFGYYTQRYPSVFYRLGVGGTGEFFDNDGAGRIHTPTFNPDEKAIGYGMAEFANIVFTMLE